LNSYADRVIPAAGLIFDNKAVWAFFYKYRILQFARIGECILRFCGIAE